MANRDATKERGPGKEIGVGVIGYGFMGRAHSFAYHRLPLVVPELGATPRLAAIAGRTAGRVAAAAARFGYESHFTDWQGLVEDARVQLVDNCTQPYLHAAPSIAALERGKHVLCEKPLADTLSEARAMREAAAKRPHLVAMCGFNYRFLPAVCLARQLLLEGEIGRVYHYRGAYLQEGRHDPKRPGYTWPEAQGRGALAALGSHVIDMARFLVGEPVTVYGATQIFIPTRPHPNNPEEQVIVPDDDAFQCMVAFENGATGVLEASFIASGHKNSFVWEVNGEKGSLRFDLERPNELEVCLPGRSRPDTPGFTRVMVTEPAHPYIGQWWPRGHVLGWEHTFVHEVQHLLRCIAEGRPVGPEGATFDDGYRAALVSEAIRRSAATGARVSLAGLEAESEPR